MPGKPKLTAEIVRAWMNSERRGYAAAAEHFGVSESALRALCDPSRARAREPAGAGRPSDDPAPPPLSLHDGGDRWLTVSEAALKYGVTGPAVRKWIAEDKVISRKSPTGVLEVQERSVDDLRAQRPEPPRAVAPGLDPTLPDVEYHTAHLRRLEGLVAGWLVPGGEVPRGGDKILTELRHERAALEAARAAIPQRVEDLPLEEQLRLMEARVALWPEQMLLIAAGELRRRYRSQLRLVRDDGEVELTEAGTWEPIAAVR